MLSGVFLIAALVVWPRPTRWLNMVAGVAATLGVVSGVWLTPDVDGLWPPLHGASADRVVAAEDASGVSVLRLEAGTLSSRTLVFVNGIGQSWIPYGDIHTVLGALPAFVHANPKSAAVIGLGSGDTVFALAGRPEIQEVTSVEIVRPQLATLRRLADFRPYPGLVSVLSDPRVAHVSGDGRVHLMQTGRRFDIIEADALRPMSAGAGHLYSDAFFALVRSRLSPGGLAVSWAPTPRVRNTFVHVFPHIVSFRDIVIGSDEPIAFEPREIRQRLDRPVVREYYARGGVDIGRLLAPYLDAAPTIVGPTTERPPLSNLNTDLFPRDELDLYGRMP
jgi:spermidine synthase